MTVQPSLLSIKKYARISSAHGERGASLVELLVSIAISIMVFSVLSTALVQFVLSTRWGNNLLQVTNDIQVASLWLGRDAPEAASFTPGSGSVYGTLNWADSSTQYRYSYDSIDSSLIREDLENSIVQTTRTIARHIENQSDVIFNNSGGLLTVTITATSGAESKSTILNFAFRTR
jgi:type II secretory pathway pseudopilin PulG